MGYDENCLCCGKTGPHFDDYGEQVSFCSQKCAESNVQWRSDEQ